jgi:hypothetical protein
VAKPSEGPCRPALRSQLCSCLSTAKSCDAARVAGYGAGAHPAGHGCMLQDACTPTHGHDVHCRDGSSQQGAPPVTCLVGHCFRSLRPLPQPQPCPLGSCKSAMNFGTCPALNPILHEWPKACLRGQSTHACCKSKARTSMARLCVHSSGSTQSIPCRLTAFHVHVYVESTDASTEALLAAAPVDSVTHPPNSMRDTVSECERSGLSNQLPGPKMGEQVPTERKDTGCVGVSHACVSSLQT